MVYGKAMKLKSILLKMQENFAGSILIFAWVSFAIISTLVNFSHERYKKATEDLKKNYEHLPSLDKEEYQILKLTALQAYIIRYWMHLFSVSILYLSGAFSISLYILLPSLGWDIPLIYQFSCIVITFSTLFFLIIFLFVLWKVFTKIIMARKITA